MEEEQKNFDIEVEISKFPDVPLYKGTKIKGSAKVFLKNVGIRLNWIPWTVIGRDISIPYPGFPIRGEDGKKRIQPYVLFFSKRLDRQVRNAIKDKLLVEVERLSKIAEDLKKKKKEEQKRKKQMKRLNELRAFFALPENIRIGVLKDIWKASHNKKPKKKNRPQTDYEYMRYKKEKEEKFLRWGEGHEKKLQEDFEMLLEKYPDS